MKKFMLLCMLSMMLYVDMTTAGEVKSCSPFQDHVWIGIKIIFHRPKFDCNSGFGICLIFSGGIENETRFSGKPGCDARGKNNGNNQLVIEVKETALTNFDGGESLPFFQGKPSISIQDPYTLPDETCKALGLSQSYTIKPGTYPVSYLNGTYTIAFQ